MTELIDKAKLLKYLYAIKQDEYVSAYGEAAVDVINHIEKYIADMSKTEPEVQHGSWIVCSADFGIGKMYKCSVCHGMCEHYTHIHYNPSPYCMHCGAKMDGVNEINEASTM